jgi:WD40 repeat protein
VLLPRPLVAFSPEESLLAAVGKSETIVWDVAGARAVRTLPGTAPVAFSSGGSALATTVECKTTTVWELRSGRLLLHAPSPAGCPKSVALSPDGTTLVVIWSGFAGLGRAMDARFWSVRTGEGYASLRGYVDDGTPVSAFSPDGKTLATGGAAGTVNIWDPATGRRLLVLAGSTVAASSLHFSADGGTLTVGHGTNVRVWRAATEGR